MIAIYKVTNPAGEVYYGQTTNFKRRIKEHKASKNKKAGALAKSIAKYGSANHSFEILHSYNVYDQAQLDYAEKFYIRTHELFADTPVLNYYKGGHSHKAFNKHTKSGWHHTPESIAKIQLNRTKSIVTPEGRLAIITAISGTNNYAAKEVVRLDDNGNYIDEWKCIRFAQKHLGVTKGGSISRCCSGFKEYAYGYKWMYKNDYEQLKQFA